MAKTKKIVRRKGGGVTNTSLLSMAREYIEKKNARDDLKKVVSDLSGKLKDVVAQIGITDDKGHQYVEFDEPIGNITGLQRQVRVSTALDEDAAIELLKQKSTKKNDLLGRCTYTEVRVDEDELMKAVFEGEITEAEFEALVSRSETPALILMKD